MNDDYTAWAFHLPLRLSDLSGVRNLIQCIGFTGKTRLHFFAYLCK